ncbi:hypothetical protein [Paludisphaera mucosa]|uniref:Uncharacterized protein n=1 Tax=Paludisphaera mucosa TaxID=3030827 RepID=A0ABT6F919_9BACT|nr:hypothetical protein [Paludisphaera mucosa]MDG3004088.1 hypothetical protein [Paludisphaera mucosa]
MLRFQHLVLSLSLVALASSPSQAADAPAVAALKEKGLTRSGRFFVIEAEQAALEKWKAARPVLAGHAANVERKSRADAAAEELAQLEASRVELQNTLSDLDQQVNPQGFQPGGFGQGGFEQGSFGQTGFGGQAYLAQVNTQRAWVRANLVEIASLQRAARSETPKDEKALEAEMQKSLEAVRTALAEFREAADAVVRRYDELDVDPAVKSAFQALEKAKLGGLKLGPTPEFGNALKALAKAERTYLEKKSPVVSRTRSRPRR